MGGAAVSTTTARNSAGDEVLYVAFVGLDSGAVLTFHLPSGAQLPMTVQPSLQPPAVGAARPHETSTRALLAYILLAPLDENGSPVEDEVVQGMVCGESVSEACVCPETVGGAALLAC
jgi:hypothetical protein